MLGSKDAVATIAVRNLAAAKQFYEGKLGLKAEPSEEPSVASYKTGTGTILVYESQFAGTNQATAATWMAGNDLEEIVRSLKAKGITFEHYDMPGMTRQGDLHVAGKSRAAWLKDPDGNILAIVGD